MNLMMMGCMPMFTLRRYPVEVKMRVGKKTRILPLTSNISSNKYHILHIFLSNISLLKRKLLCHLPFVKGKTSSCHFLKICFHKGMATFLAFYWYRCSCLLRGKIALVKGYLLFWDPFKIELATFLEINISRAAAAFFGSLWNRVGRIFGNYISKRRSLHSPMYSMWSLSCPRTPLRLNLDFFWLKFQQFKSEFSPRTARTLGLSSDGIRRLNSDCPHTVLFDIIIILFNKRYGAGIEPQAPQTDLH